MLYSEFLLGTGQQENCYALKEYERINHIYNMNEDMSKEEAYAMYREPVKQEDILQIEVEKLTNERRTLLHRNEELEKKVFDLEKQLKTQKEWSETYLKELRKMLSDAEYLIEDKLGVF